MRCAFSWRSFLIGICACMSALALTGCSLLTDELENRGGFSDRFLDKYWFRADTKEMRVLRSYMLIGSLLRLSSWTFNAAERQSVALKVNTALQQAKDAFICAYQDVNKVCPFFDDKMADLDRSLLLLAVAVLASEEDKGLISQLQEEIFGKTVPGYLVSASTKVIDAASDAANAGAKLASVAAGLLKFGEQVVETGQRLGAVYRDAIELDMIIIVLKSLQYRCEAVDRSRQEKSLVCGVYRDGLRVYGRGSGTNLKIWRQFLVNGYQAGQYARFVVPQKEDFVSVTTFIWRACDSLIDPSTKDLLDWNRLCKGHEIAGNGTSKYNAALFGLEAAAKITPNDPESYEKLALDNIKRADYADKYWSRCSVALKLTSTLLNSEKERYCLE